MKKICFYCGKKSEEGESEEVEDGTEFTCSRCLNKQVKGMEKRLKTAKSIFRQNTEK